MPPVAHGGNRRDNHFNDDDADADDDDDDCTAALEALDDDEDDDDVSAIWQGTLIAHKFQHFGLPRRNEAFIHAHLQKDEFFMQCVSNA